MERPEILKPAPAAVACEMLTVAALLFVSVSLKLLLVPAWTFPKLRLAGDADRVPAGDTPVPDSVALNGVALSEDVTERVPLAAPAD